MSNLPGPILVVIFLIVSIANNYILSSLAELGVSSAQSLLGRGMICLVCSILFGLFYKERLLPKLFIPQGIRLFLAGLGLWATVESYQYAGVSQIALISRMNIPIIIIFGFLVTLKTTLRQKLISAAIVLILLLSVRFLDSGSSSLYGLFLAVLGTVTLSISYLFLNKTAKTESSAIVSLTPSVACIFTGIILLYKGSSVLDYTFSGLFLTSLSGLTMYMSYRVTRQLYIRYAFLSAQSFFVLIPLLSIPVDILWRKEVFTASEYFIFSIVSILIIAVCFIDKESKELSLGKQDNEYEKFSA